VCFLTTQVVDFVSVTHDLLFLYPAPCQELQSVMKEL
jgi:hypothetical protein